MKENSWSTKVKLLKDRPNIFQIGHQKSNFENQANFFFDQQKSPTFKSQTFFLVNESQTFDCFPNSTKSQTCFFLCLQFKKKGYFTLIFA